MEKSISEAETLERGRDAFQRQAWGAAYAELAAADRETVLSPEDLERLAITAHLVGYEAECVDFWTRAHHEFLRLGETQRAVRCSFWLGLCLLLQGEPARSSGWLTRSQRLLDEAQLDCVEQGYLLIPVALQTYWGGDATTGHSHFVRAAKLGERFQEPDLLAIARIGMGETLIHLGEAARGVALLDEAMAAVTGGELSTMAVGLVYCAMLACCQQTFDLRRAQEWTAAFTRWCESQPDLVPYRGDCMVYRSEVMRLNGAWPNALEAAQRACDDLSRLDSKSWAGAAFYQQGELYRLRGDYAKAEEAYRKTNEWGENPQPGMALLRLAQGRLDSVVATISRALGEAPDGMARSRILPAHAEIMIACGDIKAARGSADELAEIAAARDAPLLHAVSAHATGAVLLAEGQVPGALNALRVALAAWRDLDVPYEGARVRVLVAQACRLLGDEENAQLELDTARQVFQQLGAAPDLERLSALAAQPGGKTAGGLTARELEVLRLVGAGKTNRGIATELYLSEKTVARHVSNIFSKLGLSSRAAATAYAYEHDLI